MKKNLFLSILLLAPFTLYGQWTIKNIGASEQLAALTLIHNDTIFISGFESSFTSVDKGTTWKAVPIDIIGSYFYDMKFFTAKVGLGIGAIVTSNSEAIVKTVNGGAHWDFVQLDNSGDYPRELADIDFPSDKIGYAAGSNGHFLKTTDGGNTWEQVFDIGNVYVHAISFAAPNDGYYLTSTSVNRTDGVMTRISLMHDTGLVYLDVKAVDHDNIFVLTTTSLQYSTNAGASWSTNPLPTDQINKMFVLNKDTILLGTENGLYISRNRGVVWEFFNQTKNVSVRSVQMTASGFGILAGDDGKCMLTSNFGGLSAPVSSFSITADGSCGYNTLHLKNSSSASNQFTWFINGKQVSNSYNTDVQVTADLNTVALVESNGVLRDTLTQRFSMFVNDVHPNAGPDIDACYESNVQLTATGGETYSWSPPIGLSDPNISNPKAKLEYTIDYIVSVMAGAGCVKTDTVRVLRSGKLPDVPLVPATIDVTNLNGAISAINMVDDTLGYAMGYQWFYQTINGGRSWNKISYLQYIGGETGYINVISKDTIIITEENSYRSYDGGKTFNQMAGGFASRFVGKVGYFLGAFGGLSETNDYGTTETPALGTHFIGAIDFIDVNYWIATSPDGVFIKDGNQPWTNVIGSPVFLGIQCVSAQLVFAWDRSALWKSIDRGLTWNQIFKGNVSRVKFINDQLGFAVSESAEDNGSTSDILQTVNGGECWQTVFRTHPASLSTEVYGFEYRKNLLLVATGTEIQDPVNGIETRGVILRADLSPNASFQVDTTTCQNTIFRVYNQSRGFLSYTWTVDNVPSPFADPLLISIAGQGVHTIALTAHGNAPDTTVYQQINIVPAPITPSINEGLYQLTSSHAGSNSWYLNQQQLTDVSQTIKPTAGGVYTTDYTYGGCKSLSSSSVNFNLKSIAFTLPNSACAGDLIELTNTSYGFDGYQWIANGIDISANNDFQWDAAIAGINTVLLIATHNTLSDTLSKTILVGSIPTKADVSLGDDISDFSGTDQVTLHMKGTFPEYDWSNGSHGSTLTISADTLAPGNHLYWVNVKNQSSCIQSDSIVITSTKTQTVTGLDPAIGRNYTVYPNPISQGMNMITISGPSLERCAFFIRDLLSRPVNAETMNTSTGEAHLRLNHLIAGVYILSIITPQGVVTKKFAVY